MPGRRGGTAEKPPRTCSGAAKGTDPGLRRQLMKTGRNHPPGKAHGNIRRGAPVGKANRKGILRSVHDRR